MASLSLQNPESMESQPSAEREEHMFDRQGRADLENGSSSSESFDKDDYEIKNTPSPARKLLVVSAGIMCTFNGLFGTSIPSGAVDAISEYFHHPAESKLVLLNSVYMIGFVAGPLLWGPLSEFIGRRPVLIWTHIGYLVFMLACSGAPSFTSLLVLRCLCGINAAASTAIIGGLFADILHDPAERGNAMALYMAVTALAPLFGPIASGFSSPETWRLPFWIAGGVAALGLPLVMSLPETFAPVLRFQAGKDNHKSSSVTCEIRRPDPRKVFVRPLKLLFTEPILFASSVCMALMYSLYFLNFQAYPIVFQDFYRLSPGVAALAFVPVMIGTVMGLVVFFAFTKFYDRKATSGAKWAQAEIYRRLPLSCMAAPCMVIALFWLAWTPWRSIPAIVPMIGGGFFGLAFQLFFMGMLNLVTDIYREYSASAHAAAGMMRSIGAIVLPLAVDPMYNKLGMHWPMSILGFVALLVGMTPFIFIWLGPKLEERIKSARRAVDD